SAGHFAIRYETAQPLAVAASATRDPGVRRKSPPAARWIPHEPVAMEQRASQSAARLTDNPRHVLELVFDWSGNFSAGVARRRPPGRPGSVQGAEPNQVPKDACYQRLLPPWSELRLPTRRHPNDREGAAGPL